MILPKTLRMYSIDTLCKSFTALHSNCEHFRLRVSSERPDNISWWKCQMNKNATTQLHIYSAFFVLAGFVLNRGVFLLFLAEKGMSVTEIALYQALYNAATVALELPTGLVGDFFGKKFSIQVGVLLLFFHTAGMLLLSGPFLVVLSLVEALAYSLQSGSEQALLYEIVRNAGQGERFLTINARLLAAQSIATGMAIVLGSFIAQVSWSALYVCVSAFYLL